MYSFCVSLQTNKFVMFIVKIFKRKISVKCVLHIVSTMTVHVSQYKRKPCVLFQIEGGDENIERSSPGKQRFE